MINQLSLFTKAAPVPVVLPWPEWGSDDYNLLRQLPVERFELPNKRLKHGCPICEIGLVQSASGWHWKIGYQLEIQGAGGPVDFGRAVPTRADAMACAVAQLERRLEPLCETSADARAALQWVRGLVI